MTMMQQRAAKVITFGCQMNFRDSEIIVDGLLKDGYDITENLPEADIVVINTCSIRHHAEHRVSSLLGRLKDWKKKKKGRQIGVCGCMPQLYREKMFAGAPQIDFLVGSQAFGRFPEVLGRIRTGKKHLVEIEPGVSRVIYNSQFRAHNFKALVTIMEGCNLSCSYCVVPFTRGAQRSRSLSNIIQEVTDLALRGYKEITLLGQTVNAYGLDLSPPVRFIDLLEALQGIKGLLRIRFSSPNPVFASKEFFEKVKTLDKVCEHFHLPVQSGSNKILKAMNRGYTREAYLDKIASLRTIIPRASVTTDIIVGFPGETEKDFSDTVMLIEKVRFDNAYTFKYSARPQASAATLPDDVNNETKKRRLRVVNETLEKILVAKNKKLLGTKEEVLVERVVANHRGTPDPLRSPLVGRTRTFKELIFEGPVHLISKTALVQVSQVFAWSLRGKFISELQVL